MEVRTPPLAPVLRGEGPGVRGALPSPSPPAPLPRSGGEGGTALPRRRPDAIRSAAGSAETDPAPAPPAIHLTERRDRFMSARFLAPAALLAAGLFVVG